LRLVCLVVVVLVVAWLRAWCRGLRGLDAVVVFGGVAAGFEAGWWWLAR
jgi:hypothetical protein